MSKSKPKLTELEAGQLFGELESQGSGYWLQNYLDMALLKKAGFNPKEVAIAKKVLDQMDQLHLFCEKSVLKERKRYEE
jgi:hypothetical protein